MSKDTYPPLILKRLKLYMKLPDAITLAMTLGFIISLAYIFIVK
jgi:hypothetical protein